ncbi:transglutaminase-like cysteine peptidase [Phenylobacterium sp.]|uniref:transglutaminase-like cysteine peptidase n=1 Tax=Phenylobacterium sp. TaxID=1871053 RepID=UPI00262F80FA|nr:transglutaminase-like cysteine peptidase [Phenylobacterium sp.]
MRKVAEIELARRNDAEARLVLAGMRTTTTAAVSGRNVNWATAFAEARLLRDAAEQSNAALEAAMGQARTPPSGAPAMVRVSTASNGETPRLQRLGQPPHIPPAEPPEPASKAVAANAAPPALTPALWGQLTRVNDKVNRQIVRRADIQTYGVLDRWATPLAQGDQYGDCEDYVLEKRRALLAAGVPEHAMSIAVATTNWGESHAVLVVATDQGDYVLDSLTPWILPWRKASLTWRERQVAGAPFRWALVSQAPVSQTFADAAPDKDATATPAVAPEHPELASPQRRLSTEAFNGRPLGADLLIRTQDEAELPMALALALASDRPLRGLLR